MFMPAQIAAAQAAQARWGVPASVTLAQFAVESAYGTRMPGGAASNNPFGIKAVAGQPFVVARTREVIAGRSVVIEARFRKFATLNEAFAEHGRLLATAAPYRAAMADWGQHRDVDHFVTLMAKRYATVPTYATVILSVIHAGHLQQYDAPVPAGHAVVVPVTKRAPTFWERLFGAAA